jgi:adenine deaminase
MRAAYGFNDLASFLAVYYEGMSVLLTEQDFYDLAMAYFRKAHSQNVVYAEVFFDPQAHTTRGIPFATVVEGFRRAQQDAEAWFGLRTQLIMCFLRDLTAESAMDTLEQSLAYGDWIVGVGLDSDEKNHPPVKFKDVFARARREGYRLTMHCDVDQENSVDGLKAKEIKSMLEEGVRATINSDDPAYFPGYMNENLTAVQEAVQLTRDEIVQLARNAFTVSRLPRVDRDGYLDALAAYAAKLA